MTDPYHVLGLTPDADEAAVRHRYLELVREFPPEREPERFAAIRAAYDQLRDSDERLRRRLFQLNGRAGLDSLIEEFECQTPRRRLSLDDLLRAAR